MIPVMIYFGHNYGVLTTMAGHFTYNFILMLPLLWCEPEVGIQEMQETKDKVKELLK